MQLRKRKVDHVQRLRVLLIAPDVANLDASPEIKSITNLNWVQAHVLTRHISAREVYDAVDDGRYDVIHFATHSTSDIMALNGDRLSPQDIGQIAKLGQAKLVFFNSCESGKFASYLVQRGIEFAVFANIKIEDSQAWKVPYLFYCFLDEQIESTGVYSFPKAFYDAVDSTGNYGITSAYDRVGVIPLQKEMAQLKRLVLIVLGAGIVAWASVSAAVAWVLTLIQR